MKTCPRGWTSLSRHKYILNAFVTLVTSFCTTTKWKINLCIKITLVYLKRSDTPTKKYPQNSPQNDMSSNDWLVLLEFLSPLSHSTNSYPTHHFVASFCGTLYVVVSFSLFKTHIKIALAIQVITNLIPHCISLHQKDLQKYYSITMFTSVKGLSITCSTLTL